MEPLRQFLYRRSIKNKRPKIVAGEPIRVQAAKHVGILFNASQESDQKHVKVFAEQLRQQKFEVHILGFFNEKKEASEDIDFYFFDLRHVNFAQIPKGDIVEQFIAQKYDVLINLDDLDSLPLHYIAAVCRAPMKIGPSSIDQHTHYNLMIEPTGQDRLQSFISEMRNTLKKIA